MSAVKNCTPRGGYRTFAAIKRVIDSWSPTDTPDDIVDGILDELWDARISVIEEEPLPRPRRDSAPPEVGQVWRERRRAYALRTVRVTNVDHGFVYTETLTKCDGQPPTRPVDNRVRLSLWHKSWELKS